MIASPLTAAPLFHVGPVPITEPVVITWGLMAALTWAVDWRHVSCASRRGRARRSLELLVTAVQGQIRETLRTEPAPYLPFLAGLFIFIASANLSSLIPGRRAADGPSRDRRGPGRDRLLRGALLRCSRPRGWAAICDLR